MAEISNLTNLTNSTNYTNILNDTTENITSLGIKDYIKKRKPFFTFKDFVILIIDISIVIGPSLGYLMQSLKFQKTKSSKGFSKSICLIIYISQTLRVFFWIGKPFKITLLYQSILIICFQIYLIYLWIKYHDTEPDKNSKQINEVKYNDKKEIIEYIIDWSDTISPNKVWNWSNTIEYYKFMFLIIIFLLLICGVIGIHNEILVNVIGTISVITEASSLIPQIIVSCRTKKVGNLAISMVGLWLIGDSCKFVYYIIYETPIQMIVSGGLQIFLDFFSVMQIICYRDYNPHYKNTEETNITTTSKFSNSNSKKVQQINQFMNKLEERFSEEIESQNSKREENDNHPDKNDSKKIINKVIVPERIEDFDQVEVLDKSQHDKIKNNSDDEEEKNENNEKAETLQNLNEEENENEKKDEKKEDIN